MQWKRDSRKEELRDDDNDDTTTTVVVGDKQKAKKSGGCQHKAFVFSSPQMEPLAAQILELAAQDDDQVVCLQRGDIQWDRFEDGFPNIFIKNVESMRGRDVIFLASFLNHDDLLAQISVLYALPRYLAKSLILVLPYFPTGTMERVDSEGQIATAATFARLLSTIPVGQRGPTKIIIYDIHTLQNRFYFSDSVLPVLVSAVPLLIQKLKTTHASEDIAIAFPDEGAQKRFGKMFKEWENIICHKVREGNKRIVTIKEGDAKDKHVFICDDLVKTGGTLIQCQEALFQAGAKQVSCYVTHAVFPQDSWQRFTLPVKADKHPFTRFYTTDSCPETTKLIRDKAPFEILTLADSILNCIVKY